MSDTNEQCENCKFFEPMDGMSGVWHGMSGVWDGTCTNPNIAPNAKWPPHPSWPKVRRTFTCDFFGQQPNQAANQPARPEPIATKF